MEEKEYIEVGKTYTLRNGFTTEKIEKANNGTSYIFKAKVSGQGINAFHIFSWKENGRFLTDNIDHSLDIILKGWNEQDTDNNNS